MSSIYPHDEYNQYDYCSEEDLEDELWPYNMGEYNIDSCLIPEIFCEDEDDNLVDDPYNYWEDDEF